MKGYFGNAGATTTAFMDGWLRTGDVGYMDSDGYVFLVDRIKDLIICSASTSTRAPSRKRWRLTRPSTRTTSSRARRISRRGAGGLRQAQGRQSVSEAELKKFLAEKLNKIEMPREIVFKDELPKTLIGKLSKKELREEYKQRKASKREPA